MKKYLVLSAIMLTLTLMAHNAEARQAKCKMFYVTAQAGSKDVPVSSDHQVTIRNTTGATQIYHITYSNGIMYIPPLYTTMATKEFDVLVENGKTKGLPNKRLQKTTHFYTKNTYPSQALVTVKLNNKLVDHCESKNTVYIY